MFLAPLTARSKVVKFFAGWLLPARFTRFRSATLRIFMSLERFLSSPRQPPFTPAQPCPLRPTSCAPMSTRNPIVSRSRPRLHRSFSLRLLRLPRPPSR